MASLVVLYVINKNTDGTDKQIVEILEVSWVTLDINNPQEVVDQGQLLINCPTNAEKVKEISQASDTSSYEIVNDLKDAIHQLDNHLYTTLISNNKNFCFVTDGPTHLQYLSQAAAEQNISLGVHYSKYFDIRLEFGKRFALAPQPSSLQDILQYLDMQVHVDYYNSSANSCHVLLEIVRKLIQEGHKFSSPEYNKEVIRDNLNSEEKKVNHITEYSNRTLKTLESISCDPPYHSSNSDQSNNQDHSIDTVLRLRGLPWQTTEQDIVEFFDQVNIVPDGVFIPLNRQGRPTGEAYVEFETQADKKEALKKDRAMMGRRYIELFQSTKNAMEQSRKMVESEFGGDDGLIVRMRGLPFSATARDIVEFFHGLSIAPGGVYLVTNREGRASGEAFVEFITPETARQAMKLHREMMGKRYIELFRSSRAELRMSQPSRHHHRSIPSSHHIPFHQNYQQYHQHLQYQHSHYAPSPPHSAQPYTSSYSTIPEQPYEYEMAPGMVRYDADSTPPLPPYPPQMDNNEETFSKHVVRLRGLPFRSKEIEIADFFAGINIAPRGIHLVFNHQDKPTGEAFVELVSREDVTLAMGKHKQMMGTRYIEVFKSSREEMALACQGEYPPVINTTPTYSAMSPVAPWDVPPNYWEDGYSYQPIIDGVGSGTGPGLVGDGYCQQPVHGQTKPEPGSTLKLRGLPFSSTKKEIIDFFYGYGLDPSSIRFGKNRRGKPSGEAWVTFFSAAEARRAQAERDRCHIGPRYIELFIENIF